MRECGQLSVGHWVCSSSAGPRDPILQRVGRDSARQCPFSLSGKAIQSVLALAQVKECIHSDMSSRYILQGWMMAKALHGKKNKYQLCFQK